MGISSARNEAFLLADVLLGLFLELLLIHADLLLVLLLARLLLHAHLILGLLLRPIFELGRRHSDTNIGSTQTTSFLRCFGQVPM